MPATSTTLRGLIQALDGSGLLCMQTQRIAEKIVQRFLGVRNVQAAPVPVRFQPRKLSRGCCGRFALPPQQPFLISHSRLAFDALKAHIPGSGQILLATGCEQSR